MEPGVHPFMPRKRGLKILRMIVAAAKARVTKKSIVKGMLAKEG